MTATWDKANRTQDLLLAHKADALHKATSIASLKPAVDAMPKLTWAARDKKADNGVTTKRPLLPAP